MGSMTYTLAAFMVPLNCCQFPNFYSLYAKRIFSSLRGNCGNLYVIHYKFMMLQMVSKVKLLELMLSPRHSECSRNSPDCMGTVVIGVEKPCKVCGSPMCYSCQRGSEVNEYKLVCQYASGTAE